MINVAEQFTTVTTFDLKNQKYGIEMLESYYKFWPNSCLMYTFLENFSNLDDKKVKNKIKILDFHEVIPEYKAFCKKYADKNRTDNYRYDAFKFAHKIFAINKATLFVKQNI